jgi:hypothetical protein
MTYRPVRIQDRNGVKVRIHENANGTTVEATCKCLGLSGRVHSTLECPLRKKQLVPENASEAHDVR